MLDVQNVAFDYRGRPILRDLSLTLEPGRFYAVIGPNGAGKSTLLKVVSGELAPTRGAVLLDERPLQSFAADRLAARRAVVAQSAPLSFPFKVHEVVALGISVPGFAIEPDKAPIQRAIDATDLHALHDRPYTQLSGGERQRVQIARALCQLYGSPVPRRETLLLLDEPTSNLDLPHQMLLMRLARAEAKAGRLVLAILHDINLATAWADTVIAINNGRLCAMGAPHEIMTERVLEDLYGERLHLAAIAGSDVPIVVPRPSDTSARDALSQC